MTTQTKDSPAPRPWKVTSYPDKLGGTDNVIENVEGTKIATTFETGTKTDQVNAELIVKAVNSHDELVEVAEQMAELECVADTEGKEGCNHCKAVKALALANKEVT